MPVIHERNALREVLWQMDGQIPIEIHYRLLAVNQYCYGWRVKYALALNHFRS